MDTATRTGTERILGERLRQIVIEGWTPEHDRQHAPSDLASAAHCYVGYAVEQLSHDDSGDEGPPVAWPWAREWWKPASDPIRNLEKAGALIAAEIGRSSGGLNAVAASVCASDGEDSVRGRRRETSLRPRPGGIGWRHRTYPLRATRSAGRSLRQCGRWSRQPTPTSPGAHCKTTGTMQRGGQP